MPCCFSKLRRTDAGELQQLRRVIRAAGDQDFLARPRGPQRAALPVFDRPRTASFEQDALRQRRGFDVQIASAFGGTKIGTAPCWRAGRAASWSGKIRRLPGVAPLKSGLVGMPVSRRRHDEGLRQRIGMPPVRHRQRAAGAVIFVGAALLIFGLLEIGQHVVIAPAGVAALAPAIVVLVLAAHIQQAVDRTRSAQHLAARLKHRCARPVPAPARSGTSS